MQSFCDCEHRDIVWRKDMQPFPQADLSICNLEGALTDHAGKYVKTDSVKIASAKSVEAYKKWVIKCFMLANNHATDGGHERMIDTMRALDKSLQRLYRCGKRPRQYLKSKVYEVGDMCFGQYNVYETIYNKPTKNHA